MGVRWEALLGALQGQVGDHHVWGNPFQWLPLGVFPLGWDSCKEGRGAHSRRGAQEVRRRVFLVLEG